MNRAQRRQLARSPHTRAAMKKAQRSIVVEEGYDHATDLATYGVPRLPVDKIDGRAPLYLEELSASHERDLWELLAAPENDSILSAVLQPVSFKSLAANDLKLWHDGGVRGGVYYLAHDGDRTVGYLSLNAAGASETVWIARAYRRRGHARSLYAAALTDFPDLRLTGPLTAAGRRFFRAAFPELVLSLVS